MRTCNVSTVCVQAKHVMCAAWCARLILVVARQIYRASHPAELLANSSVDMPRILRPEESRMLPVPEKEVQMRASFKLVRNSAVRLDTETPSGKREPLVMRLERNDFVRSSTAWISCEENSPSCDMAVGRKMGLVWRRVGI